MLDTALLTGGAGTTASFLGAVCDLSVSIDGNTCVSTAAGSASINNVHMAGSSVPQRDIFFASFGSVSGPDAGENL